MKGVQTPISGRPASEALVEICIACFRGDLNLDDDVFLSADTRHFL